MTELKTTTSNTWSNAQAFALAAVSLLLGLCGGWLIRKAAPSPSSAQAISASAQASMPGAPVAPNFGSAMVQPSPQDLKQAADSEAAPLLTQLKSDPANAGLLTKLGNLYYDAKQYPAAIDYYERALKSQPSDASVRTDLGTAYWYNGNADTAISQFNRALAYEPTKADTLFNLGIVKWQGKKDGPGGVAAWQKLLEVHPDYQNRDKVQQLIAQAQGR